MPKRRENLDGIPGRRGRHRGGGFAGLSVFETTTVRWVPRPGRLVGLVARDLPCAKAGCLVREPDALVAPVRFDEGDVETELRLG